MTIAIFMVFFLAVQCAGCSWIGMKRAPADLRNSLELDCSGYMWPILDGSLATLCGVVIIGGWNGWFVEGGSGSGGGGGYLILMSGFLGVVALLHLFSGATGIYWANTCRKAEADHKWQLSIAPPVRLRALREQVLQKKIRDCEKYRSGRSKSHSPYRLSKIEKCKKLLSSIRIDDKHPLAIHDAANSMDLKRVERLIRGGADVNQKDGYGWTPLHCAVAKDNIKAVELLVSAGADVNARDQNDATPLLSAAFAGSGALVELLIAKCADVNAKTKTGLTPLHAAAIQGHIGIAKILLAKGADINAKTNNGNTPIGLGQYYGHVKFYRFLKKVRAKQKSARRERRKMKPPIQPTAKRPPEVKDEPLDKPGIDTSPCPTGTEKIGSPPPDGWEQYCARQDDEGNPVKHGWFNSWFENGYPASQGAYQDGRRHGRWTFWYSNGRKRLEAEYLDDKKHGRWTFWERDGSKQKEVEYKGDVEVR